MEPDAYNAADDSFGCWALAVLAVREIGIREGQFEPATDDERRQAAEGPVRTLDCVKEAADAR